MFLPSRFSAIFVVALSVVLASGACARPIAPPNAPADQPAEDRPADAGATDAGATDAGATDAGATADRASTESPSAAGETDVAAEGNDAESAERFIRITETPEGRPKALQTSIIRYVGPEGSKYEGVIVDLVGVVHVGQKEYYDKLDQRLKTYDTVLYELVAPDGTRVRPEDIGQGGSPLSSVQLTMRDMLNLEFQLEHIDYLAENFRHADMSPEEFMEDLEDRGDSILKMGLRMMGAGLASSAAVGGDGGLLMAMMAGEDRPKKMKQAMAKQMLDMEIMTAGLDDAEGKNTLIRGRNIKAFSIMDEELAAGKKRIAVFYGAGHLPDMAERLENQYRLEPKSVEWFTAWDLQRN